MTTHPETAPDTGECLPADLLLRQNEAPLRVLIEQLPAILWTTDPRLRFTSSTGAGLAHLNLRPNQLVGTSLYDFFETSDPTLPPIVAHRRALSGESVSFEIEWQGRAYQVCVEPLVGIGQQIIGTIGVALDVTDRRLAERLEKDRNLVLELVARNRPLPEILSELVHMVERQQPEMLCSALLLRDGRLYHGAAPSLPESYTRAIDGTEIGPSVGSCGAAAYLGEAVIARDVVDDPRWGAYRDLALAHNLRACWSIPILSGAGQVMGTFAIYYREPCEPTSPELELLETAGKLAAVAIEHARLLADVERRAAEATAVAEVGRALTGSLDLQAVLELIVDQACRLLGTDRSALAIVEPEESGSIYRFVARRGLGDEFSERVRPRHVWDGTTAAAIIERRPIWSADILHDPAFALSPSTRAGVEAEGYRAVLSIPLLTGGRVVGALVVYRDTVGPFSAKEVELLRVFADQAAIALENARAFKQEQERRRQLEAIRDVTAEITRELDLGTLLELIIRRAAELVEGTTGAVHLWDAAGRVLIPRAWYGVGEWMADVRFRLGEGATGSAAQRRTGVIVNDFRTWADAPSSILERLDVAAVLSQPILYQERLVGAITVGREAAGRPFTDQDLELLALFAHQAAIAIENARLFAQAATAEALHELARLKAEFLSTASHELRTPLTLIHGYAELLKARAPHLFPEQVAAMAAEIHAGSTTMARLVDDLLSLSRLEQGQLQLARRRVTVAEVLCPLVRSFSAQPGGERIEAELPAGLEADVDPDRLIQIISNLLTNALRYAPEGPIILRAVRVRGDVRIQVTDHGPGIPSAEQPRIWEKFYRGGQEMTSPNRGSGLGLSIVKHLVELHGGTVGLRSTPGRGATFWITVPVASR